MPDFVGAISALHTQPLTSIPIGRRSLLVAIILSDEEVKRRLHTFLEKRARKGHREAAAEA